jgi:ElaB/YqjD/DUF883 family membrane-anchored ribosome-binding protein
MQTASRRSTVSSTQAGSTGQQEGTAGVAETVSEQATKVKQKGRAELREQLDERTNDVGRQARSLADALRRAGNEASPVASGAGVERVTSGVADRLEQAGNYLEQARGEEMLRDAERFVRTRPWVVAGTAAAVGFALSRILRASSEQRYDRSSTTKRGAQDRRAPATSPYEAREPVASPRASAPPAVAS